jgi:uncharacterized protein
MPDRPRGRPYPTRAMLSLRADPWAPDYGMGYEAPAEEAPLPRCDPLVETADWSRPRPRRPAPRQEVLFVDGVRRVDLSLLAQEDGRQAPGLFGSFAVGAVRCAATATFDRHHVRRAVVLGGGVHHPRVEVACGTASLTFEPATDSGTDPNAPLAKLQDLMREAEQGLVAELVLAGAPLVLADGPLRWKESPAPAAPVVGVVKRFRRRYLDPPQEALLARLEPGDRTPVFALVDEEDTPRSYSWYSRLAGAGPPWHDYAGLVRCEVRAGMGADGAVAMADRVAALLPAYAGGPADPRTPQNLAPVAALEGRLRHRMGDRGLVRRALLGWLACTDGAGT